MLTDRNQRWRDRRESFVPGASIIDPNHYAVEPLRTTEAKRFIETHHYLATYPVARFAAGLYRKTGPAAQSELAGVAVFAEPSTSAVVTKHTGLEPQQGTTLARFILLNDVAGNGETFFLSRAIQLLRQAKPAIIGMASFSDPNNGHIGQVYQAASARHVAVTKPRYGYHIAGLSIADRTISKIANEESGADGAIRRLVDMGCPPPRSQEALRTWLERLQAGGSIQRMKRQPLFVYSFAFTKAAKAKLRQLPTLPYPTIHALRALPAGRHIAAQR